MMMTITLLLPAGGFSNSAIAWLTTEQTLCDQNTPFLPQLTFGTDPNSVTNSSSLPAQYYTNRRIRINGTFIINSPTFLLINCKVQMGPGAIIIVDEGKMLDGFKTQFFSCVQMWRGISLKGAAKLRLVSCVIEDAEYAINTESASVIALRENTFYRNYIGIRLRPASPEANILNFTYFRNNVFKGGSLLNSPYAGQQDYSKLSYAGIDASECSFTVGDNTAPNTFTQIHRGITVVDATVAVRNCRFTDLPEGLFTDFGIYSEGGTLNVTWGGTEATRSQFINCGYGVQSHNTAMNVRYSSFSNLDTDGGLGIHSLYNSTSTGGFSASYNHVQMDGLGTGIFTNRPFVPVGTAVDIFQNNFVSQGPGPGIKHCLTLWHLNNPTTNNLAYVRSNTFDIGSNSNVAYCTWAVNMGKNISITGNKYNFGASSGQTFDMNDFAISVSGLGNGEISFNEINGTASPGNFFRADRAVSVTNSPKIKICGNVMNNTKAGLYFNGDNSESVVSENTMGRHRIGLWVDGDNPMSRIGQQVRTNNRWSAAPGDYIDWAAFCTVGVPPANSFFRVQSTDPVVFPSPISPMSGWFDPLPGSLNSCIGAGENLLSEADQALLTGSIQLSPLQQWESERRLLQKIQTRPAGTPIGSQVQTFVNQRAGAAMGRLVQAESMVAQAMEAIQPWRDTLSAIHAYRSRIIDSLWAVEDALALPDTDNTLNEALAQAKSPLLYHLETLRLRERQIMSGVKSEMQPLLVDALNYNEATQVNQPWEDARKQLNRYLFRQWMGIADSTDQSLLFSIALQNPAQAGEAVREARALITDPVWREIWAEHLTFPAGPSPQLSMPGANAADGFRVWPNPAVGRVHFRLPVDAAGRLLIYDMMGRSRFERVQTADALLGEVEVVATGWLPGLYQAVFLPESGAPLVIPFILQ